jgi:hypothetical protein
MRCAFMSRFYVALLRRAFSSLNATAGRRAGIFLLKVA